MKLSDLIKIPSKLKNLPTVDYTPYQLPEGAITSIKDLPLVEMTLITSDDFPEDSGINNVAYLQKHGKPAGDQDGKPIVGIRLKGNESYMYGIKNGDNVTAVIIFHLTTVFDNQYAVIDVAYTLPEYRKLNDMRRIMWFLKAQEHLKLMSGGQESKSAVAYIDKLFNSNRFDPKWLNMTTGEIKDYNDKSVKFRSYENKTDWRLIAESVNHSDWNEHRYMDRRTDVPNTYKMYIFDDLE